MQTSLQKHNKHIILKGRKLKSLVKLKRRGENILPGAELASTSSLPFLCVFLFGFSATDIFISVLFQPIETLKLTKSK